ncbi:MAG: phage minor capsid protein [Ruminococcus sp.]|nr:phage minor capsid protein [Ruminococcus sp.]
MLSPEYYEGCADAIIGLYQQLEDDIISDVIRRIMKTGKVTATARHQIEQLQETGILYDDILKTIAGQTDATVQHVKALFEDAGVETVRFDNRIYRENGLTPVDIRQSSAMRRTLEAGYRKTLGDMKNLTMTTANTSQTAYINACNQAYMQITSGAFSYQEAIRQAVQKTAQDGVKVLYPSGHTDRIDVAVRRAVLTGVGQTCREIGLMNAEECGCDLMEISAHSGARPAHAQWQGKIVSLSGRKGYLSKSDIGYGTGDGFGGWNCRHDWFPFFEGYSRRNYSEKDLEKLDEKNIEYNGKLYNQYEISQIQRRYEREIRSAKRAQVAFEVAVEEADDPELLQVMQDSLNYANSLVRNRQKKMRDFIRQTGQNRDYFREQNYPKENTRKDLTSTKTRGIINGRSSGKAIFTDSDGHYAELIGKIDYNDKKAVALSLMEFENKYKNSNIEHCRVITTNGDVYEVHGELDLVNTEMLGDLMNGSINEHNHVTGESQYSFSWEDLKSCIKDGTNTALAFDEKYRYSMQFPDKVISEDDLYDAYTDAQNEVGDIRSYDRFYKRITISDEDEQHEIVKRTCEKVGIKYGRTRK